MNAMLDPESLARELEGHRFGRRILHFQSVESTSDRALRLLEEGEPEGTLVVSEEQTRGRGRRDRNWESPPHLGIYASLVLRPCLPTRHFPVISLALAMAAARSLRDRGLHGVELKWPNDLLVQGSKLGGILAEARGETGHEGVVVGLGLNVNQQESDFPEALRESATSLRRVTGRMWDRLQVLKEILLRGEEEYDGLQSQGPEDLLQRFEGFSPFGRGTLLEVDSGSGVRRGRFAGLGPSGELLLDTGAGLPSAFHFGEVCRVREG